MLVKVATDWWRMLLENFELNSRAVPNDVKILTQKALRSVFLALYKMRVPNEMPRMGSDYPGYFLLMWSHRVFKGWTQLLPRAPEERGHFREEGDYVERVTEVRQCETTSATMKLVREIDESTSDVIKTVGKCMEDGDFHYHERFVCVPEAYDVRIELIRQP